MPHRATRPGLCCVSFPHLSQLSFVVAKYLDCAHTKHTHVRAYTHALTPPTPSVSTRNEVKRLKFRVWHQAFSSHWPATPSFSLSLFHSFLLGTPSQVWRKTSFSSSRETKTNLMEKTQVFLFFFFFFFFSNSRHNVYQYSNLSVCLHSLVQCENIASHKLLDRCSYAAPCSLHLSCLYFNTVKRSVCFG